MAISPSFFDQELNKLADKYEKDFDKILLSESKSNSGKDQIWVSYPSGYTSDIHQIIRARYINAGWIDVVINSDQRQGDNITFIRKMVSIR